MRPRIAFDRVAWHAFAFPKSLADAVIVAVGHVFAACAFAVDACIGLAAFVPASATVVVRGHEVDAVAVGRAVRVFGGSRAVRVFWILRFRRVLRRVGDRF